MTVGELEKAADLARVHKDYPQAIEYFQVALKKDRKNSVLYNKLGLAQLKNNDLPAARLSFEKSAKYNSKYADAVNNIGAVLPLIQGGKLRGLAVTTARRTPAAPDLPPIAEVGVPGFDVSSKFLYIVPWLKSP